MHLSRRRLGQVALGVAIGGGWDLSLWVNVYAAEKAEPKGTGNDSGFLGLSQITSNVMQKYRFVAVLQVQLAIVVAEFAKRDKAQASMPILQAEWRGTTQDFANRFIIPGRVPDAVILGQKLQAKTDAVLGAGVARLVLLSVILR
ncbi:hypothetical protein PsB1_0876 [Candidatus Phycosocius spiralis]|uniref:Transglycosylase SLT domain-containing protein n=2 Tax=Candidatus Phycosocius spiralis TaxID=2815099 RepID=A0ABQ4PUL8_9PROT|nr:hypothetical protein PsB1_0876 [Candidatus Phycosocius spiralis]